MTITIDIKSALIYLLYLALIILVVFVTIFFKHLITTLKTTNKVLQDATVVSKIAANRASEIDGAIGDLKEAAADISQAVKGQQNLIGAAANLIKAFGTLTAIFQQNSGEDINKKKKN